MTEVQDEGSESFLEAALREGSPGPARARWAHLLAAADAHGVTPLLASRAHECGWDAELVDLLRVRAAEEAAQGLLRVHELRRILAAFASAEVPVILLKGAHVEHVCYAGPGHRPRTDTDLLIRQEDRRAVREALRAVDYLPAAHVTGEVAFAQFHVVRYDEVGAFHPLDVHWRISNVRAFSSRLSWPELWERRCAIPALAPNAFGPALHHALMIACIHRVAHHGCSDRLIWLRDIHLLARSLGDGGFGDLASLAMERGMAQVVAAGLQAAAERFGSAFSEELLPVLSTVREADDEVRSFLQGPRSSLDVVLSDWRHLSGLGSRLTFLREHLLPPADYIHGRYEITTAAALPLLYAYRLVAGARRWLS